MRHELAELEPRPPVFTPLDAARYRLAVSNPQKPTSATPRNNLTDRQMRLLAEALAEVARLRGRFVRVRGGVQVHRDPEHRPGGASFRTGNFGSHVPRWRYGGIEPR